MRNGPEDQIMLVLIRHGATESNRQHRYLGKTDEALSKDGEKELADYRNAGYYPRPDRLFCSPMQRCIQTAEILYPGMQPVIIEQWREIDFGRFEGKNPSELQKDRYYQKWIDSNGTLPFPDGESRTDFIRRCEKGFCSMVRELEKTKAEGQRTIGIIVHGGTIMALLSKYATGDYYDYQVPNGKGYICIMKNIGKEPEIIELKKI